MASTSTMSLPLLLSPSSFVGKYFDLVCLDIPSPLLLLQPVNTVALSTFRMLELPFNDFITDFTQPWTGCLCVKSGQSFMSLEQMLRLGMSGSKTPLTSNIYLISATS